MISIGSQLRSIDSIQSVNIAALNSCPSIERLSLKGTSLSKCVWEPTTPIQNVYLPCLKKLEILNCISPDSSQLLFEKIQSSLTHLSLRCAHFSDPNNRHFDLEDLPSMWPNLEELCLGAKTAKQDFTSAQLLLVLPRLTKLKKLCLSFKRPQLEEEKKLITAMEVELKKKLSSIQIKFNFLESYDCQFDCLLDYIDTTVDSDDDMGEDDMREDPLMEYFMDGE